MNQRNTEALAVLLFRWPGVDGLGGDFESPGEARQCAEWLIREGGVLVPGAMTDDEDRRAYYAGEGCTGGVASELERIAKGAWRTPEGPDGFVIGPME